MRSGTGSWPVGALLQSAALGCLVAGWMVGGLPRVPPISLAAQEHLRLAATASSVPGQAAVRSLRRLPGIGRTRARRVADERWRRGGVFPVSEWDQVPGIGAATVARLLVELEHAGESRFGGDLGTLERSSSIDWSPSTELR